MAIDASKGFFVSDGCVIRRDQLLLALGFNADPDQETSRVGYHVQGEWRHFDVEVDSVISVTASDTLGYAVASLGSVFELPLAEDTTREIFNERVRSWVIEAAVDFGELMRIRLIQGVPFCVGQSGQVYRLGKANWDRADHGMRKIGGPDLEDIDGFSLDELYVAGIEGAIHRFDGSTWRQVSLPTNLNISNVRCLSDGLCCACGDDGLILRGRLDDWQVFGEPVPDRNYWGLEEFDGSIYLAHGTGIDRLVDQAVVPVDLKLKGKTTFHRLHGRDHVLYSFGTDHLLRFADGVWTRVPIPT
jgi:hypothetical protein